MKSRDEGVVLRRIPYGDTSLVVHCFTRDHGRLALMARGARKSGRGSGAALAGFHTLALFFSRREGAELGHLQQAELVIGRHRLPADPQAGVAALVLLEGIYRFLAPGDPHGDLYQELTTALDLLEQENEAVAVAAVGLARMARRVGYGWRLDSCAGCGVKERLDFFSVKRCQAVCRGCAAPYARHLILLDTPLSDLLTRLPWPEREAVSTEDKNMYGMLYQISRKVLEQHGGKTLQADLSFRSLLLGARGEQASSPDTGPQEGISDGSGATGEG